MSRKVSILLMFALVLGVSIVRVHQKIEILKIGYSIQEEQKFISKILEENAKLMYELSILESPKMLIGNLADEDIIFKGERSVIAESCILSVDDYRLGEPGRKHSFWGSFFNPVAQADTSTE